MATRRVAIALLPALGAALLGLGLLSIAPAAAQSNVTVAVGDVYFCSSDFQDGVCDTTVDAGDTVVWDFSDALIPHTTTECGSSCDAPSASPLWTSGTMSGGGSYSYTFDSPGTYLYYCQIHPEIQRGRIIVENPQTQPTAEDPSATPGATPSGGALPPVGTGAGEDGPGAARWIATATGLAIGGGALLFLSARRARR